MDVAGMVRNAPGGWTLEQYDEYSGLARYEARDGQVSLAYHVVLPGVLLTDIDLSCSTLPAFNPVGPQIATINWCVAGRCEVDFGSKGSMVVGEQALCLSSTFANTFAYPTARYRGFEYFVDFDQMDDAAWHVLQTLGLSEDALQRALVPRDLGVCIAPEGELARAVRAVEAELAREVPRQGWLALATCGLFLALAEPDASSAPVAGSYLQRSQRDMAQTVYQQIVERVSPVANLAGLAERFGVSEASLRGYFVRVYGQTPASFARERALAEASRLLAQTDRSVADVALSCGYANPSKFSAAFRREHDMNPLEYRRRSRLG